MSQKRTRARVQRNSVLVENTKGFYPPVRQSIHVVIRTWIAEKTFTEYFCISTSRVSLCWVKRKSPLNRLFKSEFEKRSFFVQTINDATCSNSIIYYLNKETRRVKKELLNRQNDFSPSSMIVEQKQSLKMERNPSISTY